MGYGNRGNYAAAREVANQAMQLSRMIGDRQQEMIALRRSAGVHWSVDQQKTIEDSKKSLTIAREIGDKNGEYSALVNLALFYFWDGQSEDAKAHSLQAIQLSNEIGSLGLIAAWNHADYIAADGEYESGLKLMQTGMENAHLDNNIPQYAAYLWAAQNILFILGQYHRVRELLDEYESKLEVVFDPLRKWSAISIQGLCYFLSGDRETGLETMIWACDALDGSGESTHYSRAFIRLAFAKSYLDDPTAWQEGFKLAEEGKASFFESRSWVDIKIMYFCTIARLYRKFGQVDQALEASAAAVQSIEDVRFFQLHELIFWTHSQSLRAADQNEEADRFLQRAYNRVMLVASKTEDDVLKQGWVENVPWNQEILKEAQARRITTKELGAG
jgi:tetratricopeptide (TPR) repeat protein